MSEEVVFKFYPLTHLPTKGWVVVVVVSCSCFIKQKITALVRAPFGAVPSDFRWS